MARGCSSLFATVLVASSRFGAACVLLIVVPIVELNLQTHRHGGHNL